MIYNDFDLGTSEIVCVVEVVALLLFRIRSKQPAKPWCISHLVFSRRVSLKWVLPDNNTNTTTALNYSSLILIRDQISISYLPTPPHIGQDMTQGQFF